MTLRMPGPHPLSTVIPGLDAGIHRAVCTMDARIKSGHDSEKESSDGAMFLQRAVA